MYSSTNRTKHKVNNLTTTIVTMNPRTTQYRDRLIPGGLEILITQTRNESAEPFSRTIVTELFSDRR